MRFRQGLGVLIVALAFANPILAQSAQTSPTASPTAERATRDAAIASQAEALSNKLNELQQKIIQQKVDQSQSYLQALTYVATTLTLLVGLFSLGAYLRLKQTEDRFIKWTNRLRRDLRVRADSIQKREAQLEIHQRDIAKRQEEAERRMASLEALESQLDEKHRTMLVNLPDEINLLEGALARALDDRAVADVATLYRFYEELPPSSRLVVLMAESKVPTLLLLSKWRHAPSSAGHSGDVASSAEGREWAKQWSSLLRGLGIFYAGRAYDHGVFRQNADFQKACFYFRYAIDLDENNLLARNDLGAALVSVEDDTPDLVYSREAEEVLQEALLHGAQLQRTRCNLAWVYLALKDPAKALAQLSGEEILAMPFLDPNSNDRMDEMVYLMRCTAHTQLGNMSEAFANLEKACQRPLADIQRILDEEKSRTLGPLFADPILGDRANQLNVKLNADLAAKK